MRAAGSVERWSGPASPFKLTTCVLKVACSAHPNMIVIMHRRYCLVTVFVIVHVPLSVCGTTVSFFDGELGSLPSEQGFLYLTNPILGASASQSLQTNTVILDTTSDIADQAGYFASTDGSPPLDASLGFVVRFDLRVILEEHMSNDRAGVSVIVLDNQSKAVELGFWTNEVWVQNDDHSSMGGIFTHGEEVAFSTSAMTTYELNITDTSYELAANEIIILRGAMRNYSSFGWPYTLSDFVFVGDDTRSAKTKFE